MNGHAIGEHDRPVSVVTVDNKQPDGESCVQL